MHLKLGRKISLKIKTLYNQLTCIELILVGKRLWKQQFIREMMTLYQQEGHQNSKNIQNYNFQ